MTKKCTPVKCSHVAKAVLMWLAHHHNEETGRCDPSAELIAEEACLSVRSVMNALSELRKAGHISAGPRPGRTLQFTLHPCTIFTPAQYSPLHHVHTTPAPDADPICTTCIPPLHVVHTNSKEPEDEQEINSKHKNSSKRKMTEDDFRQACAVELDFTASEKLKAVWSQWQIYRVKTHSQKRPWTEQAATIAKKKIQSWAEIHGDDAMIARVEYAIESSHQAFFEPIPAKQMNRNRQSLQPIPPIHQGHPDDWKEIYAKIHPNQLPPVSWSSLDAIEQSQVRKHKSQNTKP